ncbi:MAG TPA: hypothetical protein VJH90_01145 [archaeon]|nr:hypothetical protein [archaeon]
MFSDALESAGQLESLKTYLETERGIYRRTGNPESLRAVLQLQDAILNRIPKQGLWGRDIGSLGWFYNCGACGLHIPEIVGEPTEISCPDCGEQFYDVRWKSFNTVDVPLGMEYEQGDIELLLDAMGPGEKAMLDPSQTVLDRYGLA